MPAQFSIQTINGDLTVFHGAQRVCRVSRECKTLADVVFKPGGEALYGGKGTTGIALFWRRPNSGDHTPDVIHAEPLRGGKAKARFVVRCRDKAGVLAHKTSIAISWSARRLSYVYDVHTEVRVGAGKTWRTFEAGWYDGMEYLDVFPTGIYDHGWSRPEPWANPNPIQMQPWGAPERYRACLYQDADGYWKQFPLNRLAGRWCNRIALGGDGLFVFANERAGNPVVQLMGSTLRRSQVSVCHAMYDVHFVLPTADWIEGPCRAEARYRLFAVDQRQAARWQAQAEPLPVNNWDRWRLGLPVYAPPGQVSTFDRVIRLDRYDPSYHWLPTDAQGWEGYEIPIDRDDLKFAWVPRGGRDGKGAVMVSADKPGTWGWVSYAHPVQVKPNTHYRLSAWVRTREVKGRGAAIGITGTMRIGEKSYPGHANVLYSQRKVTGNSDWTRIECALPKFFDNSGTTNQGCFYRWNVVRLWLIQNGTGTTWFDDVLLEPMKKL